MAELQVDAHFSEPAYPQCRAIQQEVQNSWCMYTKNQQAHEKFFPVIAIT